MGHDTAESSHTVSTDGDLFPMQEKTPTDLPQGLSATQTI